jgi:hypothetical protein
METPKNSSLTFESIQAFVKDLWSVFGSKQTTPLSLYKRLLFQVESDDSDQDLGINNFIQGFRIFLSNYEESLATKETFLQIPKGTVIRYKDSQRVFIEIQKFIYKAKEDEKDIIREHLLTIAATIDPNEKTLSALEAAPVLEKFGMKGGSKEGQFVSNIMSRAKKAMENTEADDPTTAIMGLLSSGVVTDMVKGLQGGVEDGSMDMNALLQSMQGALSDVMETTKEGGDGKASNIDMDRIMVNVQTGLKKNEEK